MMVYRCLSNLLIMLVGGCITTSCMVGPDFHPPAKPAVSHYTYHPLPRHTAYATTLSNAGKAQRYTAVNNIKSDWWRLFHSKSINYLVDEGMANSPTITSAYATLREAEETLNAEIGNSLFPAFNAALAASRSRYSQTTFGINQTTLFNLFNASVNATYTLDIFGGARRQIEALAAQVDYQQFELIAAYLTLTSNIVTTSIAIASLNAQIESTIALIKEEEGLLYIIKQQYRLGGVSAINVLTQATQVDQTRATLPPLQKSLSQNRHALSVLMGRFPDTSLPTIHLNALFLPAMLPVTLPSNLVRQRPDVRAAEALLHAASAQIGVATANLLPQLTINATYGWQSTVASQLFQTNNVVWTIGSGITQPLFHGGALLANRRGAIDAYQQAAAQYRQVVLSAFKEVADVLRALDTDARTLREQRAAEIAAHNNYVITKQQYFLGGVSYINLLTAEQQYQQTVIARIQAQATRYTDTAALFQALGGGWWNKQWCIKECLDEKV